MLIPKYSDAEICEAFEKDINSAWGNVNIAGEVMTTSEALRAMGDKYDVMLDEYLERHVKRFYEYVDTDRPIGGRI